jgi:EAL and modified HD-GYP domain-containing signal transduction protein
MIYSKSLSRGKATEPLMLMVKNRTNLMESILKAIEPNVKSNMLGEAYFVGVLSLIDTIFGMELVDILEQMHISDEVKDALLRGEGKLGEIYMLVRDIEVFNTKSMKIFEERYKLKSGCIKDLVVESIEDVNSFENVISNVR